MSFFFDDGGRRGYWSYAVTVRHLNVWGCCKKYQHKLKLAEQFIRYSIDFYDMTPKSHTMQTMTVG